MYFVQIQKYDLPPPVVSAPKPTQTSINVPPPLVTTPKVQQIATPSSVTPKQTVNTLQLTPQKLVQPIVKGKIFISRYLFAS